MKLIHPDLQSEVDVSPDHVSVIAIESADLFSRLTYQLFAKLDSATAENSDFRLVENFKELNIAKEVDMVHSPLLLDFNQKKITNRIVSDLERVASEPEMIEETAGIVTHLEKYLNQLAVSYSVPISWDDSIVVSSIAKAVNVKVDVDDMELVPRLLTYMHLLTALKIAKVFIFVNLKSYLSKSYLEELYHEARLKKYPLVLLESQGRPRIEEYEKRLTIDDDLCLVVNDFEEG